jgi:ADP-ribosyl-[dinitrogen reductase] hydrolase
VHFILYVKIGICLKVKEQSSLVKSALFGLAVGDALGVPVEFKSRETIRRNPVTDMIGYGTYNLPPGTWSDDSSLAFCLAEALTGGFELKTIAANFQRWLYDCYWTPLGEVFDVGIATSQAIARLSKGVSPELACGFDESDNGNGSLMRILPLVFYVRNMPVEERYHFVKLVSSLTHGHVRSVIACFYYLEFARLALEGNDRFVIYDQLKTQVPGFLHTLGINEAEVKLFDRILLNDIRDLNEADIQSSGYVLHTLEASIWCLLTTDTYAEAVLKAVNLGSDTDTTGAVTGGLAGLLYGFDGIPGKWVQQLARAKDIGELAERLQANLLMGDPAK